MTSLKNKWLFSLTWINVAVAIVVLIQVAGNQIRSLAALLRVLAYTLVYANLTGILGMVVLGRVGEKLGRKSPVAPVLAGIVALVAIGCLLAQTLLMVTGLVVPQHFWREYVSTLRIAAPLAVVFGLGAVVHASLRMRILETEEKLHEKEVAEERARKLAAEARLQSLESRIQPHFLFNTLNSISSLITLDPARAEQLVGRLAALLRASLDTSNQPLIPLQQELAMVESYLDIQRARFGDKLRSSVTVPSGLESARVPPMSVQSLVENAVKYGITPQGGGEVVITAAAKNGNLSIKIRDTGPGFDLSVVPAGHGLDSLVSRLDAVFGTKARLTVFRRDENSVVEMVLPQV